jgi:hypothetical protein
LWAPGDSTHGKEDHQRRLASASGTMYTFGGPESDGSDAVDDLSTGSDQAQKGLQVPSDAVVDTGERKVVFVAHEGGHFEPHDVKLGVALEGAYQVLGGLREGEAIAKQGQFLLDSESRIRGAAKGAPPAHGAH